MRDADFAKLVARVEKLEQSLKALPDGLDDLRSTIEEPNSDIKIVCKSGGEAYETLIPLVNLMIQFEILDRHEGTKLYLTNGSVIQISIEKTK